MSWQLRWIVFKNTMTDWLSQWLAGLLPRQVILMATLHLWAAVASSDDYMEMTVSQAVIKWQEKNGR